MPRFLSPKIQELIPDGFSKDDVFRKTIAATNSSIDIQYCSEDATRLRGPSYHELLLDESQHIAYDQLDIIHETLTVLPTKRKRYSGTPLGTSNTLNLLWKKTNQCEWMMKCEHCNFWNVVHESIDFMPMFQEKGLCCVKCGKPIDSNVGEWVAFNSAEKEFIGFHLCQPVLRFFNADPIQWKDIFYKVQNYEEVKLKNEVLGLAFDAATTKPITLEELQGACVLGPMFENGTKEQGTLDNLAVYNKNRRGYTVHATGVDWGVNEKSSRTVAVQGGMTGNGVFEIYWMRHWKTVDYHSHIREIAKMATSVNAKCAADGGPTQCQLVRYEHGKTIERYDWTPGSDWRTARWCLHRSDVLSWVFRMIKQKKIVFPQWADTSIFLQDLLNVHIELKEGQYRQEMFYRHEPDFPDDFLHAIAFASATAFCAMGSSMLSGASSSASTDSIIN
jgi:hypothetical protein